MSAEGTGHGPIGHAGRGRLARPAWSLAAGTEVRPRIAFALLLAVALLAVAIGTYVPFGGYRKLGRQAGPWIVALAYPSWLTITHAAREMRRAIGESRRRRHGGAPWWRDLAWPANGMQRPVSSGIRGASIAVAVSVGATLGLYALGRSSVWGYTGYQVTGPQDWGSLRAAAPLVIAAIAVPLLWLLVVIGPHLGRGYLIVAWPSFPQRTGTRCAFHIGVTPGGARIDNARVFLRCVRTQARPFLPLATWNERLAWVAEARLVLGAYVGPQNELRVEFDVPASAPSTDLHAADAVRWELLVLGNAGGADYAERVTVPVYAA